MGGSLTREVLTALAEGGVAAIPTDTVYGLAARPDLADAVEKIFVLKGRPPEKPLPVLGASVDQLRGVVRFDDDAERLADSFWPGGLTIVLPRADGFDFDLGGEGADTVAVRIPRHSLALALLRETGPLAVTSANPSGEPPAATPSAVRAYFDDEVPILDGGAAAGEASTTISLAGGLKVLRAGEISEVELRQSLMS
ncbi:MAG: L-threonylcarbamoyladenylate synthase [Actinomycetota bacterium]|nr:L-threonylcarbamoyladenylate synthase [Actinomycetota bacterium]